MTHTGQKGIPQTAVIYLLLLGIAALIYQSTGDVIRAVTAVIAFTPCAYILAGSAAAAGAELSLARRGIFIRTGDVLTDLGHAEVISFDTALLCRTGSLDPAFPQTVSVLRRMGLHPVLRVDKDRETAAHIGAAAGISDLRTDAELAHAAGSSTPAAHVRSHQCAVHGSTLLLTLSGSNASADAMIRGGALHKLPILVRMARRTREKIEQNEIFGNTLGFIGVGLAAAGILSPVSAVLWHLATALILLLNAAGLCAVGAREKKFAF